MEETRRIYEAFAAGAPKLTNREVSRLLASGAEEDLAIVLDWMRRLVVHPTLQTCPDPALLAGALDAAHAMCKERMAQWQRATECGILLPCLLPWWIRRTVEHHVAEELTRWTRTVRPLAHLTETSGARAASTCSLPV